ncbi:MAG: hypothetical protein P8Y07_12410, partial [Gemmatimonadales bacterium]
CKVTLYDGSYHEVDSSEHAFKAAGSMASARPASRPTTYIWAARDADASASKPPTDACGDEGDAAS